MNPESIRPDEVTVFEADASESTGGEMHPVSRKKAEEYVEKMRQYRPEEYKQLMKERKRQNP